MKPTPEDWDALQMLADLYAAGAPLTVVQGVRWQTCLAERYIVHGFPAGSPSMYRPLDGEEFYLSQRSEYEG